ncbi:MAG: hypothetical protein KGZ30_03655 [Anaplasmataceae bacterium]|nr:hypothetical protein [Anaplasmataceae bacterium]
MKYRRSEGEAEGPRLPHDLIEPKHYHGRVVRRLLLLAGVIMLVTLPFFIDLIPKPTLLPVVVIIGTTILAGILNPRDFNVTVAHICISAVAIIIFEYYAIDRYQTVKTVIDFFFVINELLVMIFLFVLYFSTKTLRGMIVKNHH